MRAWRHPEFRRGAIEMLEIAPGIAAWGLVAGVAMAKSGLSMPMAMFMSLIVFAGSAQLASVPLIAAGAPIWVVWATALCINLRFVVFSSQWRPYFGHLPKRMRTLLGYFTADLNYVVFMRRFPDPRPAPEQLPYFWGGVGCNWIFWQVPSFAGIVLADQIPASWGLAFAGTMALVGLTATMLGSLSTWAAAGVAGCAAVAAYALPLRLNIVIAIAAAVGMGVMLEHMGLRPKGPGR
ncbi:AzlC family ABC transporter permease [Aquincola sp. MAHUQ-54]|uniref:AzlC family ABC transporter permease n=1 Tax=Aquincola agrisoli TaxID=3119538 RepID=A0AAW9QDL0_9BURK